MRIFNRHSKHHVNYKAVLFKQGKCQNIFQRVKNYSSYVPVVGREESSPRKMEMAFYRIRKEQNLSEQFPKCNEPQILSFKDFMETIESFDEFLNFPSVQKKIKEHPGLNTTHLYIRSSYRRYCKYKIYFYGCKLLYKKNELFLERKELNCESNFFLIKVMEEIGFSHQPIL